MIDQSDLAAGIIFKETKEFIFKADFCDLPIRIPLHQVFPEDEAFVLEFPAQLNRTVAHIGQHFLGWASRSRSGSRSSILAHQ
jgi:hypothetical protein